jgi:hypothetical protein
MTIPAKAHTLYEQFSGHCVLVRGPCKPFWLRKTAIYHQAAKGHVKLGSCEATEGALSTAQLAMDEGEIRMWSFHLFIWPVGIVLDNNIFSGNNTNVEANIIPLALDGKDLLNSFGETLTGMVVFWMIGDAGGRRDIGADTAEKVDPTKMFGKSKSRR